MLALKQKSEAIKVEFVDDDPEIVALQEKINHRTNEIAELTREAERGHKSTAEQWAERVAAEREGREPNLDIANHRQLVERIAILNSANKLDSEQLRTLRTKAAARIREKLTPHRQKLLAAIDKDLLALTRNIEAYESFLDDCERAEVVMPRERIGGKWMCAALNVYTATQKEVRDRLQEWRTEFKNHGFLHQ